MFTANKVLGIVLFPFIIALAFMNQMYYQVAFTLSIAVIGFFYLYRFFLGYSSVHKKVKINLFHFLIYLGALEIAPILLINKLLLMFF